MSWIWYVMSAISAVIFVALLIYTYIKDRRYERKKTSEAMSAELWNEIEQEREESFKRRQHFKKALDDAGRKDRY